MQLPPQTTGPWKRLRPGLFPVPRTEGLQGTRIVVPGHCLSAAKFISTRLRRRTLMKILETSDTSQMIIVHKDQLSG